MLSFAGKASSHMLAGWISFHLRVQSCFTYTCSLCFSFAGKASSQTLAHSTHWSPSTCPWNFGRNWFPLRVQEMSCNPTSEQTWSSRADHNGGVATQLLSRANHHWGDATQILSKVDHCLGVATQILSRVDHRWGVATQILSRADCNGGVASQILISPVCETLTGTDSHCTFRIPATQYDPNSEQCGLWNFVRSRFPSYIQDTSYSPNSGQSRLWGQHDVPRNSTWYIVILPVYFIAHVHYLKPPTPTLWNPIVGVPWMQK